MHDIVIGSGSPFPGGIARKSYMSASQSISDKLAETGKRLTCSSLTVLQDCAFISSEKLLSLFKQPSFGSVEEKQISFPVWPYTDTTFESAGCIHIILGFCNSTAKQAYTQLDNGMSSVAVCASGITVYMSTFCLAETCHILLIQHHHV